MMILFCSRNKHFNIIYRNKLSFEALPHNLPTVHIGVLALECCLQIGPELKLMHGEAA